MSDRDQLTNIADIRRFWSKVRKSNGCWLWRAYRSKKGYGRFQAKRKNLAAHRVAFRLSRGPIPHGKRVGHRCYNLSCVRPRHLFVGSAADINENMRQKGRLVARPPAPRRKLTEKLVRLIRSSPHSQRRLARRLRVHQTLIGQIRRREIWVNVT